jgi:transcription antitermination factor NusG
MMGLRMAELCLMITENVQSDAIPTHAKAEASKARWYAVQTMPRHEKKVSAELGAKAIHCFLPTMVHVKQWSDRKKAVVEPLFAGYVFVRIDVDSSARIALLRTKGVVGLVGVRGVGVPIPESEIIAIQTVLEGRIPFQAHEFLNTGQRVRIRGGALDGLEGILQAVKGDQSLVISIELIQRSLAVTVSGYNVEPIFNSSDSGRVLSSA